MNKKIVFVTGSLGMGGAERVISILSNHLNREGYEIKIIQIYNSRIDYHLNSDIEVVFLSTCKKMAIRNISLVLKLRKEILLSNPTYVISFLANVNIYALLSLLFVNIPCIVSERNDPNREPKNQFLKFLRNILYKKASKIVCQTSKAKNYFLKYGFKNVIIIPNPIEVNYIESIADYHSKRLITIGRLAKQKNHLMMLKAFIEFKKNNPSYTLEIYGEGPEKSFLENYISDNQINGIKFMGFKKDIEFYVKGATGFILTSDFEGMPNALMEALAYGIPSVSTNCEIGGPAELIENDVNGYLVDPGNYKEFAKKMAELYGDFSTWIKFSRESIETMKKYYITNILEKWIETLNEIL